MVKLAVLPLCFGGGGELEGFHCEAAYRSTASNCSTTYMYLLLLVCAFGGFSLHLPIRLSRDLLQLHLATQQVQYYNSFYYYNNTQTYHAQLLQ